MGIFVKRKKCELLAEGLHNAVISQIEDLDIVETANGRRDKGTIFDNNAETRFGYVITRTGNLERLPADYPGYNQNI